MAQAWTADRRAEETRTGIHRASLFSTVMPEQFGGESLRQRARKPVRDRSEPKPCRPQRLQPGALTVEQAVRGREAKFFWGSKPSLRKRKGEPRAGKDARDTHAWRPAHASGGHAARARRAGAPAAPHAGVSREARRAPRAPGPTGLCRGGRWACARRRTGLGRRLERAVPTVRGDACGRTDQGHGRERTCPAVRSVVPRLGVKAADAQDREGRRRGDKRRPASPATGGPRGASEGGASPPGQCWPLGQDRGRLAGRGGSQALAESGPEEAARPLHRGQSVRGAS